MGRRQKSPKGNSPAGIGKLEIGESISRRPAEEGGKPAEASRRRAKGGRRPAEDFVSDFGVKKNPFGARVEKKPFLE